MLKFSANLSLLFTETELSLRFKAAKLQGFSAVELQFPYQLAAHTLAELLAQADLKLVLFNVAADDLLQGGEGLACVPNKKPQFRLALEQAYAYAQVLKPEVINVLPGRCHDLRLYPAYLDTLQENLALAAETFAPLGIKTVFEAINSDDMPGFLVTTGAQMLAVLAQVQHANLFMQYDIYHAYKMGADPAEFIRQHADNIAHIQFADCPGRGQPGTGQIDFKQVFGAIRQSTYSGWIGAEYKPTGATVDSLGWFSGV